MTTKKTGSATPRTKKPAAPAAIDITPAIAHASVPEAAPAKSAARKAKATASAAKLARAKVAPAPKAVKAAASRRRSTVKQLEVAAEMAAVSTMDVEAPLAIGGHAIVVRPTDEQIRLRAYELYLRRGCAPGDPALDWYLAEQELLAEAAQA